MPKSYLRGDGPSDDISIVQRLLAPQRYDEAPPRVSLFEHLARTSRAVSAIRGPAREQPGHFPQSDGRAFVRSFYRAAPADDGPVRPTMVAGNPETRPEPAEQRFVKHDFADLLVRASQSPAGATDDVHVALQSAVDDLASRKPTMLLDYWEAAVLKGAGTLAIALATAMPRLITDPNFIDASRPLTLFERTLPLAATPTERNRLAATLAAAALALSGDQRASVRTLIHRHRDRLTDTRAWPYLRAFA